MPAREKQGSASVVFDRSMIVVAIPIGAIPRGPSSPQLSNLRIEITLNVANVLESSWNVLDCLLITSIKPLQ